jgi:hypothetical protein
MYTLTGALGIKLTQSKFSSFLYQVISWPKVIIDLGYFLQVLKLMFCSNGFTQICIVSLGRENAACPMPLPLDHAKGKLLTSMEWARRSPSSFTYHAYGLPDIFLGCQLFHT